MHLFLTSSPCDDHVPEGACLPCILDRSNSFVDNLLARFVPGQSLVVIAADPLNFGLNDEMADTFTRAFAFHGMEFTHTVIIDRRTEKLLDEALYGAGVVILGGGHVPTQHAFFERIGLRERLAGFDGIVMGISAGTMNCCDPVYAQPEERGETIDPNYRRFLRGLGLTDVMVLPHYQMVKDNWLDGQRLFDDITLGDSLGRVFYALVDGSYVLVEDGHRTLYGEAYRIADGELHQITQKGDVLAL